MPVIANVEGGDVRFAPDSVESQFQGQTFQQRQQGQGQYGGLQEAIAGQQPFPVRKEPDVEPAVSSSGPNQGEQPLASSLVPVPGSETNSVSAQSGSGRGPHLADANQSGDVPADRRAPLRDLLQERKIVLRSYAAGQQNALKCPQCLGGSTKELSFSINIDNDGTTAAWKCHRGKCGFEGGVNSGTGAASSAGSRAGVRSTERLQLNPLKDQPKI